MSAIDLIASYKELGYGGLLILLVLFIGRYLLGQNKACYDKLEKRMTSHKNEIKDITNHMFEIVKDNTRANTALRQSIEQFDKRLS